MQFKFQMEDWQKQFFVLAGLLFLVVLFILPDHGHKGDIRCWADWSAFIRMHGLTNIYYSDSDYLPAYHYILYLYGHSRESIGRIYADINYFKMVVFLFHLGSSYIMLLFIRLLDTKEKLPQGIFYLLNIAVLYNTLVWGQVDEMMTFFVALSLYLLTRDQPRSAMISYLIAINLKLQSIVFLPLILLIVFFIYLRKNIKTFLFDLFILLSLQYLIFLPFILTDNLHMVWNTLFRLVDSQPLISANAFNLWFAIVGIDARGTHDTETFIVFTYKQWGLFLFFLMSFFALLPLFIQVMKRWLLHSSQELYAPIMVLIFGMMPLLFFFFCTQMHERYSHPAIFFLVLYSILSRKWHIGLLGSLAYLLNIDGVLRSLKFQYYGVIIYDAKFVAALFFLTIILCYKELYSLVIKEGIFSWKKV
jgi:Gpi18-like mannosyltransferase